MESHFSPEQSLNAEHTHVEFQNLYACQKIIRDWNNNSHWRSYDMIPILYTALHTGKKFNPSSKDVPSLAGVVRNTSAILSGYPNKDFPEGQEVYMLTSKFSEKLDEILRRTPKTDKQAVEDAAFAYYVFCRIHPFPDGNGRVGRMIAKVIFKRAGLKDPVFHDQRWYGGDRSEHLEAIERVDETNNIAYMEVFFAKALIGMYDPIRDFSKHRELSKIISDSEKKAKTASNASLNDLWEEFTDPHLYGNNLSVEK